MSAIANSEAVSSGERWTGVIISSLVVLFLIFDAVIKLVPLEVVTVTMDGLGYPSNLAGTLGVLTLICTAFYAVPRTSVLGAILLTAYLGGAVATHLRIGSPLFTHTLFGVYLGLLAWGGLFCATADCVILFPSCGDRLPCPRSD
jgi:sorbitol-specific phosphotransferase system component IIC